MKRILLLASLVSIVQIPVHANSKLIKWVSHENTQKTMMRAGKAVIADATSLGKMTFSALKNGYKALPALPSCNDILQAGDALVKAPYIAYHRYPALMTVLSIGASLAAASYFVREGTKAEKNGNRNDAEACAGIAVVIGTTGTLASIIAGVACADS